MSIFSRFADIINSNINALLDKAEDPEKLIRMIIQEMEDTLVEVRTSSAKTLAERKVLGRRTAALSKEVDDWQQKAELALSKDREDLAKAALVEKAKVEDNYSELSYQVKLLDESIDKLAIEIAQLQDKLTDARARQQALKMRHSTQSSRLKIKRTMYESTSTNAVEKFEQFERKLDSMEAEVDSLDLGRKRNLQAEIDDLQSDEKVDAELDKLKSKIKKNQ